MNFKITKQFPHQQEVDCARFVNENEAKLAMQVLFANDFKHKSNVIYRLSNKYGEVILMLDTNKDQPASGESGGATRAGAGAGAGAAGEAGGSGRGQTSGFRPTPFSTTPTPPGGPQKWTTLNEDDKDKDEKK